MIIEDYISQDHVHSSAVEAVRFKDKIFDVSKLEWQKVTEGVEITVVKTQHEPELFVVVCRRSPS